MTARISPDLVKAAAEQTAAPEAIVRDALARQTTDKGAIFEDAAVEALTCPYRLNFDQVYRLKFDQA